MQPTVTARSRVLQCYDIVQLICAEVGIYDRRTLFRLCRTCKGFVGPALDMLWYKLDSLYPLLHCLPSDLYKEHAEVVEGPPRRLVCTLSFQRPILASDWEIFEVAAARVHILSYTQKQDDRYLLHSSVFQSLACAARGRTGLLPRLRQLIWAPSSDDIYPYIFLFLSPTITNLTVSVATANVESDRMRFSLLTSLPFQCPSMRSLRLDASKGPARGARESSWSILFSRNSANPIASFNQWITLGSLSLQNVDLSVQVTNVLVALPALTKLELYWCKSTGPSPRNATGFRALQHLSMYQCNMDSCLYVLKRMSRTPLVRLDLSLADRPPEARWVELFNNLQSCVSRNTLDTVSFAVDQPPDLRAHPTAWTLQTITPLLHFRKISDFKHSRYCNLQLSDDDIVPIVRAWPQLKSFIIRPMQPAVRPGLTHRALISFAQYCPKLEFLSISIDATGVGNSRERPGSGFFGSRLREMVMSDSPIQDPACVAAFISAIFPNLRRISSGEVRSELFFWREPWNGGPWGEVQRLIPIFEAVRRQESNHVS